MIWNWEIQTILKSNLVIARNNRTNTICQISKLYALFSAPNSRYFFAVALPLPELNYRGVNRLNGRIYTIMYKYTRKSWCLKHRIVIHFAMRPYTGYNCTKIKSKLPLCSEWQRFPAHESHITKQYQAHLNYLENSWTKEPEYRKTSQRHKHMMIDIEMCVISMVRAWIKSNNALWNG